MSQQQAARRGRFINVLFDTETNLLLGRGGDWISSVEFFRNPPQKPEDTMPPPTVNEPAVPDPSPSGQGDPGPQIKCLNHKLHSCNGTTCTLIRINGQTIAC
jgi:hypothetical protein